MNTPVLFDHAHIINWIIIKKTGSIIMLAINNDDPVNDMGDTFGII